MGRLTAMGKWTRGVKHTRLPMDIIELPTLSMRHDKTVEKYNFNKLFQTCIPNMEAWEEEEEKALLRGKLCFTDGYKGERWASAGLYDSAGKRGLTIPLGQYPTVFQAEVFAILHYAKTLVSEKTSDRCISICSDSQAAVRTVGNQKSLRFWCGSAKRH